MNILALNSKSVCICRPDTSLNKENEDFYVPEDIEYIGWSPVLYARICKAGKAVQPEFADRYYDSIAFGVFLHPSSQTKMGKAHFCTGRCSVFDRSTLLPYPLYGKLTLTSSENRFSVKVKTEEVFNCTMEGMQQKIEEAIVACSRHTSVRIGDFVAVELAPVQILTTRNDGDSALEASFCDNNVIDIRIIY